MELFWLINLHNLSDILLQILYAVLLISQTSVLEIILGILVHSSVEKFRHNFVARLKWPIGRRPYDSMRFDGFPSGQGMTTGSFLYQIYYCGDMTSIQKFVLGFLTLGFLSLRWFTGRHTLIQLIGGLLLGFLQRVFSRFMIELFGAKKLD